MKKWKNEIEKKDRKKNYEKNLELQKNEKLVREKLSV